eukprot:GEZU01013895.1.p1 GENE.GEZU01013895.1~~GEZU01013895.1.p1  ORF type:complete len:384 (+),score=126.94 GEZU01013895.1:121-1272(+)
MAGGTATTVSRRSSVSSVASSTKSSSTSNKANKIDYDKVKGYKVTVFRGASLAELRAVSSDLATVSFRKYKQLREKEQGQEKQQQGPAGFTFFMPVYVHAEHFHSAGGKEMFERAIAKVFRRQNFVPSMAVEFLGRFINSILISVFATTEQHEEQAAVAATVNKVVAAYQQMIFILSSYASSSTTTRAYIANRLDSSQMQTKSSPSVGTLMTMLSALANANDAAGEPVMDKASIAKKLDELVKEEITRNIGATFRRYPALRQASFDPAKTFASDMGHISKVWSAQTICLRHLLVHAACMTHANGNVKLTNQLVLEALRVKSFDEFVAKFDAIKSTAVAYTSVSSPAAVDVKALKALIRSAIDDSLRRGLLKELVTQKQSNLKQ